MALGIGYGLPFVAQHGTNPYKTQWAAALEGAKGAGATVEDENAGTGSCLVARGQEAYTDGLPSTPSLLIVPQFYKAGNLYQDVPPFVAEDSTMRFTVSRNTTATRVNSSGLIESIASGVPRIDWLGQSCPALLVEASGQNLCLQSEAIGITSWLNTAVTASPNVSATLDPAGGNTAEKIIATAVSGNHFTNRAASPQVGQHTFSVFAKVAEYSFIRLQDFNTGKYNVWYDLVSGTANGTGASIQNYGNGWYRCIVTYDGSGANAANGLVGVPVSGGGVSYTGDGTSGVYVWGAQLETGSVATTYIPTTTGTGSRAADVISASGALVSGLIGQTEGTIYVEVDIRNWTASGRVLAISDGTSDARVVIQVGANRTLQAVVTAASGEVANIATASGQVNGIYKCAVAYASGDFAFYVNANQIGTDSSGAVPACNNVALGKIETSASTNFLNDRIRDTALYTTRLTDAQLAELTRL